MTAIPLPPEYVMEAVRHALAEDRRVALLDVTVSVDADVIVVRGVAESHSQRDGVSAVLSEAFPDRSIRNELTVHHLALREPLAEDIR